MRRRTFITIILLTVIFAAPAFGAEPSGALENLPTLPSIQDLQSVEALREGVKAYDAGKYREAAAFFENYLADNPGSAQAQFMLGATYLKLERFTQAEWYLQKSADSGFNNSQIYMGLAEARLKTERYGPAAQALEQYLKMAPGDTETLISLATLYYYAEDYEKSAVTFGRAVEKMPGSSNAWFNYGVSLARLKKWDEALKAFDKSRAIDPGRENVDYYVGILYYQQQKYAQARPALERALTMEPGSPEILSALGVIAAGEKKFDVAEGYFRRSMAAGPDEKNTVNNLLLVLVEQEKAGEAIEVANNALKRWKDDPELLYALAVLKVQDQKYTDAREVLEKLAKLQPKNAKVRKLLASLYEQASKTDEAVASYRAAIRLEPDDVATRLSLADLLRRGEKKDEALAEYKSIIKLAPDNEDAWRKSGLIIEEKKDTDEDGKTIVDHYTRMVSALPESDFPHARLGYLAEYTGDTAAAAAYFDRALEKKSVGDLGVYIHRAQIFKAGGEDVRAGILYREGLELLLEHSQEVVMQLMGEIEAGGGQLDLQKLIEIGEREKDLDKNLSAAVEGVLSEFTERGDRPGGLKYFREMYVKFPKNKYLIKTMAGMELEDGNYAQLKRLAEELLKIDKKDAEGHMWMATSLEREGDTRSAGLEYMRAVESDPKREQAYAGLIESYRAQGRLETLVPFLEKKLEDNKHLDILTNTLSQLKTELEAPDR